MPLNSNRTRTESFCPTRKSKELENSARDAIKQVLRLSTIVRPLKELLLRHLLWQITTAHGKYRTRFRSAGVCADKRHEAKIHHEHVFPLEELIQELIENANSADSVIDEVLRKAIGCVVTEDEHKRLKAGAKGWKRYAEARDGVIPVHDMSSDQRKWKVSREGNIDDDAASLKGTGTEPTRPRARIKSDSVRVFEN